TFACGPSNKEIAGAKTARYSADPVVLFNEVKAAVEQKYKIQKSDETQLGLQTVGKWYTPDGLVSERQDDVRYIADQSLNIALVVTLVPVDKNYVVKVAMVMARFIKGRPNPDKLDPKDPSVPGWAQSRADQLAFDIYAAVKKYEVKSGGPQMLPPPETAPAPATTPPAPTPGSDTPTPAAPPA
ncbi:MAG: hypothetical protein NT062_30720, partial [Proteobacteria bacterium]|nr:hypothetical protein [Pseudomonadota bacterium]